MKRNKWKVPPLNMCELIFPRSTLSYLTSLQYSVDQHAGYYVLQNELLFILKLSQNKEEYYLFVFSVIWTFYSFNPVEMYLIINFQSSLQLFSFKKHYVLVQQLYCIVLNATWRRIWFFL